MSLIDNTFQSASAKAELAAALAAKLTLTGQTLPTSDFHMGWPTKSGTGIIASQEGAPLTKWLEFDNELSNLRKQLQEQAGVLNSEQADKKKLQATTAAQKELLEQYRQKEDLAFLLGRVGGEAQNRLLTDPDFKQQFLQADCSAFVVSVDIRRSTELMLKARRPDMFAKFISNLCSDLEHVIKDNGGVFDKFTGDGILAFFPDFYSGPDSGLLALRAAQRCQEAFRERYKECRNSFSTVLNDVGLGIGIDYGPVHLLRVAGGLTVVGSPVVYACRLSGAPAGHTYLNQPAFEIIGERYGNYCYADEASLDIKHEGSILCYDIRLTRTDYQIQLAQWQKEDS